MSSQNFTGILQSNPGNLPITFRINTNQLSISNGSQIQLSGTDNVTGTDVTNFTNAFDDSVTYYVADLQNPSGTIFTFRLSASNGGPAIGSVGFIINNPGVVSFSLSGGICFLGNTLVNTDQGKVKFNELTTKNTINKHQIKKVVSVINKDDTMILIKKDSLGDSVPNKDTYISNNHKILIDGNYFEAKNIVNNINIHKKKMPRKRLYNVLLDHHGKMIVNNMVVETLDPKNKFAQ